MSKTSLQTFGLFLGLAAIVAAAPFLWSLNLGVPSEQAGLAVGKPMPKLTGEGSVNGELPSAGELQGQVVVVNAWSTWCPQCHKGMPALVELHRKYAPKGVVFIGLTAEDESALGDIRQFVSKYGVEWPNAYGALESSRAMEVRYIPGYWVFDRSGKVVWNTAASGEMESAIEKALAGKG